MLKGEKEIWPRLKSIIQEISILLAGTVGYEMRYYNRSGNKVADRIAKETATFTSIVPKLYFFLFERMLNLFKQKIGFTLCVT